MITLSSAARAFVAQGPVKLFIDGQWVGAHDGATLATRDPGEGTIVAQVASGGAADVDRAVAVAERAFRESGWAELSATERGAILHRLADLIGQHGETLAQIESLDVGKPRMLAAGLDVPHAALTFRYYADLAVQLPRREEHGVAGFESFTVRHPYGVCGFIFPWNFPLLLLAWGVAPALAAGNTVVIKPAEDSPLSTLFFAQLAAEAGVPAGVINVVPGLGETAGAALAGHPGLKRMSFTGSPEVGRLVAAACGRNLVPVKLELGGKGAAVVFADVDVEATADALAGAVTLNSGQLCCTATRWLVQESIRDRFVARVTTTLAGMKIGHGADADTQIGPLVSEQQRARVLGYLARGVADGARLLLAGGRAEVADHPGGFYVKPALLAGGPDNVCAREEIFGPVAYLMTFREEDEAIRLVNSSPYGLGNSVWSQDLVRAGRVAARLIAGISWINGHNLVAPGIPYVACNLSGCGGGVLSRETLTDYFRNQSIVRAR